MTELANRELEQISAASQKLSDEQVAEFVSELPGWHVVDGPEISILQKRFSFSNFAEALNFTNAIGQLAESVDHHPELVTEWGAVTVKWWTHSVQGLHLNDFVLAARTNSLLAA